MVDSVRSRLKEVYIDGLVQDCSSMVCMLTNCGLVMPYGDSDLGQNGLR